MTGEVDGREAKFFSVSDHEGQPIEEIKGEFCIWGKISRVDKLDPVMDP